MSGLRIAFFGSSLVSSLWNGAATYYRGIVRALAERGHHITFFEPDAYGRQQHRDLEDVPWAESVVYAASESEALRALERASGADLVVKASGVGVFDELLEREVLSLQGPRTLVAFWDVDAPATLARVAADPTDAFRYLIPRYDLVLTYGGGRRVEQRYLELGAQSCTAIYNAVDPRDYHPVPFETRFAATLAFLGNRLPDREARVHEFFFRPASALREEAFLLGGSGWEFDPSRPNVRVLGHVPTRDHNAFYCSAHAVINITRADMAEFGFSPATRVFEAAGAGACLITDAWVGVDAFLEPEREVLVARDGEDVIAHLGTLDLDRASAIGLAARARVLAEHTYAHRAEQVERVLGANEVAGERSSIAPRGTKRAERAAKERSDKRDKRGKRGGTEMKGDGKEAPR